PWPVLRIEELGERIETGEDQRLELMPLEVGDQPEVADVGRERGLQQISAARGVGDRSVLREAGEIPRETVEVEHGREAHARAGVPVEEADEIPSPLDPASSTARLPPLSIAAGLLGRALDEDVEPHQGRPPRTFLS